MKHTTYNDISKAECERRKYAVHREGLEHSSSNTIYFYCPWCNAEVKAYVWSICGGGKRCECGALFSGNGLGYKMPEETGTGNAV